MQSLIVASLVLGCTVYAVWTLMPAVARRALATRLLRWPHLPGRLEARLRRSAEVSSGCACDGCDAAPHPAPKADTAQPIRFHPRPPR